LQKKQKTWTVRIRFLLSIYFFRMIESENFYNDGFGWICRTCERESETPNKSADHSRLMREGESESKTPRLSISALARWTDKSRQSLVCPRCGITEKVFTAEAPRHGDL
jgi:hypothetical protein